MPRKLKHKTVVSTLRDIVTEGEALSTSGDIQVAGEGRRSALLAGVLLQVVSFLDEKEFNEITLANYSKKDVAAEIDEEATETDNKE